MWRLLESLHEYLFTQLEGMKITFWFYPPLREQKRRTSDTFSNETNNESRILLVLLSSKISIVESLLTPNIRCGVWNMLSPSMVIAWTSAWSYCFCFDKSWFCFRDFYVAPYVLSLRFWIKYSALSSLFATSISFEKSRAYVQDVSFWTILVLYFVLILRWHWHWLLPYPLSPELAVFIWRGYAYHCFPLRNYSHIIPFLWQ